MYYSRMLLSLVTIFSISLSPCNAQLLAASVETITPPMLLKSKNELKKFIHKNHAVVIKFFASWCGACTNMKPLDEIMQQKFNTRVSFALIDIDQTKEVAEENQIKGVPTYIFFRQGKEVARQTGSMDEKTYTEKLQALL